MELRPMIASVAIAQGTALEVEVSSNITTGELTFMGTESAAGTNFSGILMEPISATDADYATSGKLKLVAIPQSPMGSKAEFKDSAGTLTATLVNSMVEFADSGTTLASQTLGKGAIITKFISATRGECIFSVPNTETA